MANEAGFSALAQVRLAISKLTRVPSQVAKRASGKIAGLIGKQFSAQTDAYGAAWAPLTAETIRRWGTHPILDLTGAMNAVEVKPLPGAGISITLGEPYAAFHQVGTRYMPPRPILPTAALPAAWNAALKAAAEESAK
jgi:hypothetical protein